MRKTMRSAAAVLGAGLLAVGLSACSGGEVAVGETAKVDVHSGVDVYPFEITVASIEPAPAEVQAGFEGDDPIYFADVSVRYVGDEVKETFPHQIYNSVYAKLDDGSFVGATFTGLTECAGMPEDPQAARAALEGGETVSFCAPVAGDGGHDVTGVYVGSSDIDDGGTVWKR